jgi:tRNA A-37 threonylcarbamoyl transferase component Bud32
MLHEVECTPKVRENVIHAFEEIHAWGVYHGDVRSENILVRSDESVVVLNFEISEMDADDKDLDDEMEDVKRLVEVRD